MKRVILTSLFVTILQIVMVGQNRKIELLKNEPFEKASAMAKKEKKLLFLDFGSPRCSPCLFMKNNIFTIDSVADFVNARFISVDYTEGEEKSRLSQIYSVNTEPVFLIVDADGNLMHRTEGKSTAAEMLERFRQGIDPTRNLTAMNKKYDLINLAGKMSVLIFKKTSLDHVLDAGWTSIYEMKTPWPHLVWFIEMLLNSGKILILPYSTNYIVSDSRYNLIQDGLVRLNILVVEYAALLIKILSGADEEIKLFSYQHIAQKRIGELLKILAYSTYLNGYGQTIKAAFEALKKMPLKANKVIFTGFYLFPSLLPIFFRKWLFKIPLILRPNWLAYKDFIRYLQEVSRLQKVEHQGRNFNPQDL